MPLTNVIIEIHLILLFTFHNTKNIACQITEVLIFYADKLMVMGNQITLRSEQTLHIFSMKINYRGILKFQDFSKTLVCFEDCSSPKFHVLIP